MGDIQELIQQSAPVDVTKEYDTSTLKGKTVVITGGAKGLGAHMVRRWASLGAHIVIGDVADADGEQLVGELRRSYPEATFAYQRCDVTDWDSQVALFDTAVRVSPSKAVDVVVPNAGIIQPDQASAFENPEPGPDGRLKRPDTATLEVNIVGVVYTTHLALYHLPRNGSSKDRCILLIGSVASLMPLAGQTHYAMSKHAVLGLFRTLRATASLRGVRVNMLAPYFTSQTHMMPPVREALFLSGNAGAASVADVIDAATRLVADEAVAGRALVIGPRMKADGITGAEDMAVGDDEGDGQGRAIWECYAHDYDQVDPFVRRYLYLIHAVSSARGWLGVLGDIWRIFRRK
ncbi:hypothetical protein B0J13DRAFT_185977 [Dactylonectria estremocensis]|uniref:5'-hydroxyaverantin dehydrogenase n=1 Tax=Dactylonectria estremocensis TaxID=1079267 RepID=A0A9P9FC52_9HYPO|nr:hypothetical protein B0J13DRAFT_185977 [Dactylonectria estremocensis]